MENVVPASIAFEPKGVGYGLPCSNCRAYYPADIDTCPICKSTERVSARAVAALPVTAVVTRSGTERWA